MSDAGIVAIGGGSSLQCLLSNRKGKMKSLKTTVIMAHDWLEWSLSGTFFFNNPDRYDEFISTNKETFEYDGVEYAYDVVTEVKPDEKIVVCKSGRTFPYSVLIVSSGYKMPLLHRELGIKLEDRRKEIKAWSDAFRKGKTIVVNGAGPIGLEWVCDIKIAHPDNRVILLSRSGLLMSKQTNEKNPKSIDSIKKHLSKIGVEVVHGTPAEEAGIESMQAVMQVPEGKFKLTDGNELECNVYVPAFTTGLNTDFLPEKALVDGRLRPVDTNGFLQCNEFPNIFAVGVNSSGDGFSMPYLKAQGEQVVKNINLYMDGKPLEEYKIPIQEMEWGANPPTIKLGYGEGGYLILQNLPGSQGSCLKCCGWPFCPLICCLPCCGGWGSRGFCGMCCSDPEGTFVMKGYESCCGIGGVKKFPAMFGSKGYGRT